MTTPPAAWMTERRRPRVIIIGGGFGGLYAARALKRDDVDVLLLDRTNHHLFQPLLYQVATATLAPTDITAPIRWLLRKQRNAMVLMQEVTHVDVEGRTVTTSDGDEHAYDYLVVATGARHSYFAHPEWEPLAPGLKSIDDAVEIRRRVLTAFERAEVTDDPEERAAWMTFVIIGGGPTGVELAGMLPTIARRALAHDFRRIDPVNTRVVLLEGGPKILPSYPDALSDHARLDLTNLGVDVRTGALASDIGPHHVQVGDETIHAHTILWAAGNAASPLGQNLNTRLDRAGRVPVEPDLSVPGHREVFVIGDLAAVTTNGKPVPGVAPAAMQMGTLAAKNIRRDLEQRERVAFVYKNKGDLATIGRHRAIAHIGRLQLTGGLAWWFWLLLHIMYLAGFRNRASVLVEWAYSYFTYERGARLITGTTRDPG
ncbi:MAG: Pyridine nucleotide-disulfide oxidoreductase, FAD/NAD(P)-binding domain protein [Gemmatimonadetes bacterium]|nr:Pyridine nucleotide-disulfide oxidoreductase, FAD/NAD(P)-binding domain protein [Gemmatimonadota bacterium]